MKIGYLHIGPSQHGVCRYGRLLASEAKKRKEITVIEAEVILTNNQNHNKQLLVKAAHQLSEADIIHFQSSKINTMLWGAGWLQLDNLQVFFRHCSAPLVVTLHDIDYPPYGFINILKYVYLKFQQSNSSSSLEATDTLLNTSSAIEPSTLKKGVNFLRRIYQGIFSPESLALHQIINRVQLIFVCTEEEKKRLCDRVDHRKLKVVPLYVETRSINLNPTEVRTELGLEKVKTVTLLGFIHPAKGYQLVVDAISELPPEVKVIFAGGSCVGESKQFIEELIELAKAREIDKRLRITGYLSEAELEKYLVATDLAICPFKTTSASASMSTWISAARPILASDLPQIAEYNKLELDAIKIFKPYTSTALAQAILQFLPQCRESEEPAIASLRQKLSLPVIFNKHLNHYRKLNQI